MLEGIGLSAEQEETYLGMLTRPGQSLDDIAARHPERPRPQTVTVVETLVELGLATRLAGSPPLYTAIAPDVAVEGLVRARIDDARRASQAVPALMDRFWAAMRSAASVDFIEIVTSESAILQRWGQLGQAVSKELRAFDCPPYFADPLEPDSVELQRLADGVAYRVIYAQHAVEVPGRWADLEAGIAAGEQARVLPDLPAKLTLFDDFAATLSVQTGSSADRLSADRPSRPSWISRLSRIGRIGLGDRRAPITAARRTVRAVRGVLAAGDPLHARIRRSCRAARGAVGEG